MQIMVEELALFVKIDQSLEEFAVMEIGQKPLYVQLDKALYGCVQSMLLWYELLTSILESMGSILNPYDSCVSNNVVIDGKHCTICWNVNDNQISHINFKVVDGMIEKIERKFGKMSQTKGR